MSVETIGSEVKVNGTTIRASMTEHGNIEILIDHANDTRDHFVLGYDEVAKLIDALRYVRYY